MMRWLTSIRWIPSFVLARILLVDAALVAVAIGFLFAYGMWPVALYLCLCLSCCLVAVKWLGGDWLTQTQKEGPEEAPSDDEEDTDRFQMN